MHTEGTEDGAAACTKHSKTAQRRVPRVSSMYDTETHTQPRVRQKRHKRSHMYDKETPAQPHVRHRATSATTCTTTGLLTNTKIVQKNILDRTEKKLSLLEGRRGVRLFSSADRSPPSLNNELDISSPNFIALGESYFIVKMRYSVKNNLDNQPGDYTRWVCTTSPAFSWFKNIRVEINGTEVTQSSKVADMQMVQHILSLMESSSERIQYVDSDLYGLQKLDPQRALRGVDLSPYQLGVKRKHGYAFETNAVHAHAARAPDFAANFTPKRAPTVELVTNEGFSNTVQENALRAAVGRFQYKLRPFLPFFNQDDAWLPPGTQVKLRFDLPQSELSRYIMLSDQGGGVNNQLIHVWSYSV